MDKKEIKMTREDAHKKFFQAAAILEGSTVDSVLRGLEAIGLIKFEEDDAYTEVLSSKTYSGPVLIEIDEVIKSLTRAGYKVTKS